MRQSLSNLAAMLAFASFRSDFDPLNIEPLSAPIQPTQCLSYLPPKGGFSYLQPKHFRTGQAKARRTATKARNQARHRHHCKRARSARKGRA